VVDFHGDFASAASGCLRTLLFLSTAATGMFWFPSYIVSFEVICGVCP
jgi:hypothetical protein